jgi:hypothetical protein
MYSYFWNTIIFCENRVFISDLIVLQKVPKKQGQNLPLVSLYRIKVPLIQYVMQKHERCLEVLFI